MCPEIELTEECRRVLHECESEAAAWGLRVAVRDCCEVPGLQTAEGSGLFVPHVDAMKFGIPAGVGLAVVDVEPLLALSDPIGRIASTAAHEIAHGVQDALESICFGPALATPEDFEPRIWTPERLQEVGRPAWLGHGPEFLRAASHSAFRMWEADLPVSLEWAVNHGAYNLSPFAWYFAELRDECERLADRPIVQALRTEAPEAFLKLWAADVARAAGRAARPEKIPGSSRRYFLNAHYSEEPSSAQT